MAKRGNWSREPCSECGNDGLASRGEEDVIQGPYICSDCNVYGAAFDAGYEARRKDEKLEVATAKANALAERTAMQHESNRQLEIRRAKKAKKAMADKEEEDE